MSNLTTTEGSFKPGEYLNPINNTGEKVVSVTPDLTVAYHSVR
jgi:hypothetical protein